MMTFCRTVLEDDSDKERFTRLYRANRRQMARIATQILGPGPQAEDAVHDAFLKFIRHFDGLRGKSEAQIGRWLIVVVKNTALDILRKGQREVNLEPERWDPAAPADDGDFHALVALIRGMPEEYRRILELRFVAEWSTAAIAAELGLTEGAVKTRIFRGRKLLIRTLKREGYLDGWAIV